MRQSMISIGDDYWIENGAGQRAYKVDGKAFRVRKTLVIEDAAGNEAATLKEKLVSVRDVMTIERGGQTLATVKKAMFTPLRERFDIECANGIKYEVKGKITDHQYEFERDGNQVASVSKKWFRVRDSYGVEIGANEDVALVLAATVAIDQMTHDVRLTRTSADLRHQPLVPDAVRLVGGGAQLLVPERLVVADVALEEPDLAVALEGEDVGRDPVQEPAVVADDDDAAGERLEPGLQRPQRVDVEVVRRLVEEQDVAAGLEQLREMDPVPLATRQLADDLLLVGAAEVERRDVRAGRHLARAGLDDLGALGDLLEDGLVGRQVVADWST